MKPENYETKLLEHLESIDTSLVTLCQVLSDLVTIIKRLETDSKVDSHSQ